MGKRGLFMDKKKGFVVPFGEKFSYGIGMLGTNLTFGLVSSYILIFYTDVFKITPAVIGVLLLVARIWDAVNDPMMGVIADKTRTKWGKFRPYILLSAVLLPLFTYLVFASPNLSQSEKTVYAFVTYIGWGMAYTISDIPKWSIASVMTGEKQERVGIISIAKTLGMIGTIGVNIAIIPMVNAFGKGDQIVGYRITSLVIAIAVALATLLMFFTSKERISPKDNKPTLKESFNAIAQNKPLVLLLAAMFISTAVTMIGQALQIHYIKYNFGDENLVPLISGIMIAPMLLGAVLASVFTKKVGKKKTMIISFIVIALSRVAMFIVGYTNIPLLIGIWAPSNFFFGLINVVSVAMLTDTIDYAERKTGVRNEGMIFSTQTFMVKLSGAIGGFMGALALSIAGYIEGVQQSVTTLNWIHAFMSIIPAIATALGLIPLFYYKMEENDTDKL
jgi:GPH family glycoside/pentoside/hexuronide:cation symporter/probable glucitol transport protein GutA